jgi:hypothetical protein
MTPPEHRPTTIDFGKHGNDAEFVLDGWSGPEANYRWAVGSQSALRLPPWPAAGNVLMSLRIAPAPVRGKPIQSVILLINDVVAATFEVTCNDEYTFILQNELFQREKENLVQCVYRHSAAPGEIDKGEQRELSVSFQRLFLESTKLEPLSRARLLPRPAETQPDPNVLKELAERFQGLGQNCEFGLFQRGCGAEPYGLLRFASIFLSRLLRGVRTSFYGIDDPANLTMDLNAPGGEYIGHHSIYGLDYHTFRNEGEIDPATFVPKEPARLGYLARLLMDQIKSAEKIFVVQRRQPLLTIEQAMSLLLTLRAHNPGVQLLYVTAVRAEFAFLVGRVEQLAPGFFRGYVQRFAPDENAHELDFPVWLQICATVAAAVPL